MVLQYVLLYFFVVLFIGAGIMHFIVPGFYLKIMPHNFPIKEILVALSGITEVIAGLMLCWEASRMYGGYLIVLMLIVFIPVHIYHIQEAGRSIRMPLWAAWGRMVLQLLLIAGAWYVKDL